MKQTLNELPFVQNVFIIRNDSGNQILKEIKKEEEYKSIQLLSNYYFGKSNFVKSELFGQVLLSESGYEAEGNVIIKGSSPFLLRNSTTFDFPAN